MGDTDARLHANPTRIIGLASSSTVLFSRTGILRRNALAFTRGEGGIPYKKLDELLTSAKRTKGHVTFVDVTALKEPMIALHQTVIENSTYSIITANKNPIADFDIFLQGLDTWLPHAIAMQKELPPDRIPENFEAYLHRLEAYLERCDTQLRECEGLFETEKFKSLSAALSEIRFKILAREIDPKFEKEFEKIRNSTP